MTQKLCILLTKQNILQAMSWPAFGVQDRAVRLPGQVLGCPASTQSPARAPTPASQGIRVTSRADQGLP